MFPFKVNRNLNEVGHLCDVRDCSHMEDSTPPPLLKVIKGEVAKIVELAVLVVFFIDPNHLLSIVA